MSQSAENDAPYRAVLGLFLEHVHIGVSNDFIVVETVAFDAPAPIRSALSRLMEEWIDGEAVGVTPPANGGAASLQRAAHRIEAELVCCDVFDRLRDKPSKDWTDEERVEYRRHSICYWGEAARRIVLDECVTPPAKTGGES